MEFNPSFTENDGIDLVANGFAMTPYNCGWITNGQLCNAQIPGKDIPSHLKNVHRANDTSRLECKWYNCSDQLNKGCLTRHVQEKHLEYRWPCPRCNAVFTRRGVMDIHRAGCSMNG